MKPVLDQKGQIIRKTQHFITKQLIFLQDHSNLLTVSLKYGAILNRPKQTNPTLSKKKNQTHNEKVALHVLLTAHSHADRAQLAFTAKK